MAALFVGGKNNPPPWEYIELKLCRDVYHCPPDVLARQDWKTVRRHLAALNIEAEVREANEKKTPGKKTLGG